MRNIFKDQRGFTLFELLFVIVLILVVPALLGLWTDRNLDFWLTYFKGAPVDVPYYLSLIVTIVGNAIVILANVIGEIARLLI